jgi:hypothetical protein
MITQADIRRVQEWMGPRRHPDDDALPPLRAARRGRAARRACVRAAAGRSGAALHGNGLSSAADRSSA